jgi:hypothetical protein
MYVLYIYIYIVDPFLKYIKYDMYIYWGPIYIYIYIYIYCGPISKIFNIYIDINIDIYGGADTVQVFPDLNINIYMYIIKSGYIIIDILDLNLKHAN